MNQYYKASCLCGDIKFEASGFSRQVANCYCSMCRKFHGAAFGTLVETSSLKFISGLEKLAEYAGHNGSIRSFCKTCGSSIGFRVKETNISKMEVAIALFDEDIPVSVDAQIFTNYKACWSELDEHLCTFKENRT